MYRYDYVLRLIERLGQVIRTLRDRVLRRQASTDDVRAEIREIARDAGLDLDMARSLDPGTLATWLAPIPDRVDAERVWLMAELLYADAQAVQAAGAPLPAADLHRALTLFARLPPTWRPDGAPVSAGQRVEELQALLRGGADPPPT